MLVLLKLTKPQGSVWSLLFRENHDDHIAEKGFNSLTHCNLVHKFIPMLQAMKIPGPKAAVDKRGKHENIPAWQIDELCCIDGLRTKASKLQRSRRAPRRRSSR